MEKQLTPEQEMERDEIYAEQELVKEAEAFYVECLENDWYRN